MKQAFWLEAPNQAACEIAASLGLDVVLFDLEHGVFAPQDIDRLVPLCRSLGLETYVRVACAERWSLQHALDTGAAGVILPQIRDVAHACEATAMTTYPPLGSRGMGFGRSQGFAAVGPDFAEGENRRTMCYAMIETPQSLADSAAIAALDTVDGLFVGPGDLSLSRGRGPNRWTPDDLADLRLVAAASRGAGKLFATTGGNNPSARRLGEEFGADFMSIGDDLTATVVGFTSLMERAAEARDVSLGEPPAMRR
jgi:2-dehydro-3-deoxyglucarate aldolase/4-hydroxy-2-oxoheptanedioate aldolase